MNKFLSFGNSVSNPVTTNETINDASDDAGDDVVNVPIDDDRVNQNTIILQNQSSVPNLTSFLGDVYASGIIKSSGLEVTGNIVVNGKLLSTSSTSSSSSTDLNLIQERLDGLQTQINEFINQDEINELRELVSDLTFKNETNVEISSLKVSLLNLESKFDALTN